MTQQFALRWPAVAPSFCAADFLVSASNDMAYRLITSWPQWPASMLWLSGAEAVGKSHLAAIWQQQANAYAVTEMDRDISPERLVEETPALLLDGQFAQLPEEWLFHLINAANLRQCPILWVERMLPARLVVALPDLRSRLRAIPVAPIGQPDDALMEAMLVKHLVDRQLRVSAEVISYLKNRLERSGMAVAQAVEQIDRAALQQKKPITLPFVRQLLNLSN